MAKLHELPAESKIPPTSAELVAYAGLREIRFRREGKLEVGLFYEPETEAAKVGLAFRKGVPVVFEVPGSEANPAFEHPWGYAPPDGKVLIEEALSGKSEIA